MSYRRLLPLALLVLALPACGGSGPGAAAQGGRPDVVATTTQLGDIVRNVAGAHAEVHQILRPNTDPHEYEPRPDDVKASAGADLVVESGNNLDAWMTKVLQQAGGDPAVLTIAPDHTPDRVAGESAGPEASRYDPHWWHDPANVESAVVAIRDALTRAAPDQRAAYRSNATAYVTKLHHLDAGIKACFERVPASQRKLVTSHDAFNYFARRYGIDVVGAVIPSQSTEAQPSANSVAKLAALVRREHVRAIYPESSINPKLAQALARDTGAKADYVLYGDTLGPRGSAGDTYLKMEQANADALVAGFTGGAQSCRIARL